MQTSHFFLAQGDITDEKQACLLSKEENGSDIV